MIELKKVLIIFSIVLLIITMVILFYHFFYHPKIQKKEVSMFERQKAINKCLEETHKKYITEWNNECRLRGKEPDSPLPVNVANDLIAHYNQMRKECLELYMIIPP